MTYPVIPDGHRKVLSGFVMKGDFILSRGDWRPALDCDCGCEVKTYVSVIRRDTKPKKK